MQIIFNNQIKEIENACPLQHLLDEWPGEKQKGIAVAVNGQVIPKIDWHTHLLNSNDDVLLIRATQGG